MKIDSIDTRVVERFYRRPFVIAGGSSPKAVSILVMIRSDTGLVGLGEATPMPAYSGQTVAGVVQALKDYLVPALLGQVVEGLVDLHGRMEEAIKHQPMAKAAIDLAIHDLLGKAWGVPVHALLGGRCRSAVSLGWAVGLGESEDILEEVGDQVKAGFRTIKIKIGLDPDRDVHIVGRVRELVGSAVALRVDGNEGYDLPTARKALKEMERYDLSFIEQPIPRWDLDGMAELCRSLDTPVMADESLYTPHDAIALIKHKAADIFNIKLMKVGGLYPAGQVAAIAAAAGIPCMVGSMPEMGVATAAGLHFAAASPAVTVPSELIGPLMLRGDIVDQSFYPPHDHGTGRVPTGLGLGVSLKDEGG